MAIRFEVIQPGGARHEVELPGTLAVIGRDPTCDVVLSDAKCSRRHAVVEEGPDGLFIRDSGSANGVYVNGQKRQRAPLHPGDRIRLGEVELTVLPVSAETLVMAPPDLDGPPFEPPPPSESAPGKPASPPVSPAPDPGVPARGTRRKAPGAVRPPTVTLLSVLWGLAAPLWVGGSLALAFAGEQSPAARVGIASLGLALGGGSGLLALGLARQAPWARSAQVATAAVGIFACPFAFASLTVLLYMLRPDVRAAFGAGPVEAGRSGAGPAETTFSWSIVGMLALGAALSAAMVRWLVGG